jgi:hypothetical protein
VDDLLKQANDQLAKGDWDAAAQTYRKAAIAAEGLPPAGRAQSALLVGQAIEAMTQRLPRTDLLPELQKSAQLAYQTAAQNGAPAQRAEANNNIGVLYIKQRQYPEAVQAMSQIDFDSADASNRFIYHYNYARALEAAGKSRDAYAQYVAAINQPVAFEPASVGAFRVLEHAAQPGARTPAAAGLANRLINTGQPRLAAQAARASLLRWGDEPRASELLFVLARYYLIASVTPEEFDVTDGQAAADRRNTPAALGAFANLPNQAPLQWRGLSALAEQRQALRDQANQIRTAYSGESLPTFTNKDQAVRAFGAWAAPEAAAALFSDLLRHIGRSYQQRNNPKAAMARYMAAWWLDIDASEAALAVATLLKQHHKEIDPDGRLYQAFIDSLFEAKGDMYKRQFKQQDDWLNILRTHLALGSIFASDGKWGDEYDARSATFQFHMATVAERRIRERDREFPPSPGLYTRLAQCYEATGKPDRAAEQYVTAAESYADYYKDPVGASATRQKLQNLNVTLSPDQVKRLQRVDAMINSLPKTTPRTKDPANLPEGLTPDQRQRIQKVREQQDPKIAELQTKLQTQSIQRTQQAAPPPDAFEKEKQLRQQLQSAQQKQQRDVETILTPDQRAKLRERQQQK